MRGFSVRLGLGIVSVNLGLYQKDSDAHVKHDCIFVFYSISSCRQRNLHNKLDDGVCLEMSELALKYFIGSVFSRSIYACFPTGGKPMVTGLS